MREFLKQNKFEQSVAMLIALTFIFLVFYLVTYSWFGEESTAESNVITLGSVAIQVDTTPANLALGNIDPNTTYNYSTEIKSIASNPDSKPLSEVGNAYIRLKFNTLIDEEETEIITPIYASTPTESAPNYWIKSDDGWYYYVGYISNELSATFNNQIETTTFSNQLQGKTIVIKLIVEAIQRQYKAYESEWLTAPANWISSISVYDIIND